MDHTHTHFSLEGGSFLKKQQDKNPSTLDGLMKPFNTSCCLAMGPLQFAHQRVICKSLGKSEKVVL